MAEKTSIEKPRNMWLDNIKDWTRVYVDDLMDSSRDIIHWINVRMMDEALVCATKIDRLGQGIDDDSLRQTICQYLFLYCC